LAHVSDEKICRILSWFAQGKMKVALCETKEQQRKVYNLGCPAYSENLISGFQQRGYNANRNEGLLPLDLPTPPNNFKSKIQFAVNLLEFTNENAHLRRTLFFSVFSNTIVLDDLESAQVYREHLIRSHRKCPAILTMNGDMISGDGLMDPNRKCPQRLEDLRFTFGELPHTGKPEFHRLVADLHKLEELRKATFDTSVSQQEVQQCNKDFRERQSALEPRITELEAKLRDARFKIETLNQSFTSNSKKQHVRTSPSKTISKPSPAKKRKK